MTGFSHELLHEKREATKNHCQIIGQEVNVLEGHHAIPKCMGGSNNSHNCIMLSGYDSYSVYGIKVPDVHEEADQMALKRRLFLHPDTLEYVTIDKMPEDCFRNGKNNTIYDLQVRGQEINKKCKKKKKRR